MKKIVFILVFFALNIINAQDAELVPVQIRKLDTVLAPKEIPNWAIQKVVENGKGSYTIVDESPIFYSFFKIRVKNMKTIFDGKKIRVEKVYTYEKMNYLILITMVITLVTVIILFLFIKIDELRIKIIRMLSFFLILIGLATIENSVFIIFTVIIGVILYVYIVLREKRLLS